MLLSPLVPNGKKKNLHMILECLPAIIKVVIVYSHISKSE